MLARASGPPRSAHVRIHRSPRVPRAHHARRGRRRSSVPVSRPAAPMRPRQSGPAPAGMFVSLPPWAVARNVGWPEQARLAARVGYKGIDWAFGPAKTAGVEATKALLAEIGIVADDHQPADAEPARRGGRGIRGPARRSSPRTRRSAGPSAAAASARAAGRDRQRPVEGGALDGGPAPAVGHRRRAGEARDARSSLEFLGPLMFRRARPRPGAPPPDPAAPPPPPPVPFVWTLPETLRLCRGVGAEHRRHPRRLALVPLRRHRRRHPRRQGRAHPPHPRLGRQADAAGGGAGQHAPPRRRGRHRPGRLLPGAEGDRLPGRGRARRRSARASPTACRPRRAPGSPSRRPRPC